MRAFILGDFKLFIVHFLSLVIVKFISRIRLCFSTWPLLGTSYVMERWTGVRKSKALFCHKYTHSCFVVLLLNSQAWNRSTAVEECSVTVQSVLTFNKTRNETSQKLNKLENIPWRLCSLIFSALQILV